MAIVLKSEKQFIGSMCELMNTNGVPEDLAHTLDTAIFEMIESLHERKSVVLDEDLDTIFLLKGLRDVFSKTEIN